MKKQLLTTAVALAMLAPTITSFAATNVTNGQVGGLATQTHSSNLSISGTVNTSTGAAPEGQISVTLPTAISFVVDEKSNVITPTGMIIKNNSQTPINVAVSAFADSNPSSGIELVTGGEGTLTDRTKVKLDLTAGAVTVPLLTTGFQAQPLGQIAAGGGSLALSLSGKAGQKAPSDDLGATDTFTLEFTISKN